MLGALGMDILMKCFSYNPLIRLQAGEVLDHRFLQDNVFPLLCVEYKDMPEHSDKHDGHGRRRDPLFTPDVELNVQPMDSSLSLAQTIFPGKRHSFGIRTCVLCSDLVDWILHDDAFIEGTVANTLLVELVTGSEDTLLTKQLNRRAIADRKVRIAGHLGTSSGVSMIKLCTKEPCPIGRVIDLMTAWKQANIDWLKSTGLTAKTATRRLAPIRRGENGKRFLKQTVDEWFLSACEATLTDAYDEASGYLGEDHHNDGPMSVFHGGLTLGGRREMRCDVPGYGRMVVCNQPGTFYFGNLSGPPHQVFHKACPQRELAHVPGLGYKSVTIMMRTGLHPFGQSRKNNHPTNAPAFRKVIDRVFVEALQDPAVRLPTFEEVLRAHDERVGGTLTASMVTTGTGSGQAAEQALARDGKRRRISQKSAPSSGPLMR